MRLRFDAFKATALAAGCTLGVLLTGCAGVSAIGTSVGSPSNPTGAVSAFSGKTYGAFNPISNATVTLYAAGASAGSATALTFTMSKPDGSFDFVYDGTNGDSTGGTKDVLDATFACPSSTTEMYVVSRGGNTSGTTSMNGNSDAVLIAAVGQCSSISGSNSKAIKINEATTVAAVWSMQQFMNGTTGTDVLIGAANATALDNAYTTSTQMANLADGTIPSSTTAPGSLDGVTMTITPDAAKIASVANVLAGCVNQSDASQAACTALMSAAKSTSNANATDTASAAYNMATNPTATAAATYATLTGYQPFGPALQGAPLDWTIGVSYTASGTPNAACSSAAPFKQPSHMAIDAAGNVWVNNGAVSADAVVQVNTAGALAQCVGGTYTAGDATSSNLLNAVAIDIAGNLWYSVEGSGGKTAITGNGLYELVGGTGSPSSNFMASSNWPNNTNGFAPSSLAATKAGEIVVGSFNQPDKSHYDVEILPITSTTPTQAVSSLTSGRPFYLGVTYDPSNPSSTPYIYENGNSSVYQLVPSGSTPPYTYTSSSGAIKNSAPTSVLGTGCTSAVGGAGNGAGGIATDRNGLIVGTNCSSSSGSKSSTSPFATWFQQASYGTDSGATSSAQFLGGLNTGGNIAVDGSNNYWAGLQLPVVGTTTYAFAAIKNDMATALSPAPASGFDSSKCTNKACTTGGGFQSSVITAPLVDTAIDSSGNVWGLMSSTTSSSGNGLVKLVGAAAPVVTPLVNSLP